MAVFPRKSQRQTHAPDWSGRVKSCAQSPTCTFPFAGRAWFSLLLIASPPLENECLREQREPFLLIVELALLLFGMIKCIYDVMHYIVRLALESIVSWHRGVAFFCGVFTSQISHLSLQRAGR